ncbi:class I SAM-dependent methyltransferase [Desulfofarcimen acetoxidans]|nr:methyltransferase domain-containing protein [Desulfofarcimen acetoxidans]
MDQLKMLNKHRTWFNEKAAVWDSNVLKEERCQKLHEIIKNLGIKVNSVVLDVGTGTGVLIPWLKEAVGLTGKIIAVDFAEEMLQFAIAKNFGSSVNILSADVHNLPFENDYFDEVVCNSAFPHFHNKPLAMQEMTRVLKPGGRLSICHPAPREELNSFHRNLGGVVANDMLPAEEEMVSIANRSGLTNIEIKDGPQTYLLTGRKAK